MRSDSPSRPDLGPGILDLAKHRHKVAPVEKGQIGLVRSRLSFLPLACLSANFERQASVLEEPPRGL